MCHIAEFRTLPQFLLLDGNLRVSRCYSSVHRILEWDSHRSYRIRRFPAATSRELSSGLRCSFLLSICQDAISCVMYSPMSFFETTVRTIWLSAFPLPLNPIF